MNLLIPNSKQRNCQNLVSNKLKQTNLLEKLLQTYSTISLQEMDQVRLLDRVETKFIFSIKQLPMILEQLRADYRVMSIDGNLIPQYKTVYYDTDNLFFYYEHHRKRKNRYKVRFRNYVDSDMTFLEVKHKKKGRMEKERVEVENEDFFLDEKNKQFLREANINQEDLKIMLTNTYNRITLVANHSAERATFDFNIQYHSEDGIATLDNLVIAELKQATLSRDTPMFKVLRSLQIRACRFSKYCIGIIKTYGADNIKYNRFKKILLKLNKIAQ